MCKSFAYRIIILIVLLSMTKKVSTKYNRGRVILYDRVPDDVYQKILEIQMHIKKKAQRGKVSMSDAITKIIRATNGTVVIILVASSLFGCEQMESKQDKFDRFMSELVCPIILVSKTDKAVDQPTIVVRDGYGRVRTFTATYGLPVSVADSRNVGDTLRPCN